MKKQSYKKVSVIIPTYNESKNIKNCLNALLNQSYPKDKYEIIVVDDGSEDSTGEIIKKEFGDKVKFIKQERQGAGAARNNGVKMAKGEIIIFIDADCIATYNWIEEMVKLFTYQEIIGVQGAYSTYQQSIIAQFCQIEFEERYDRLKKKKYIDFVGSFSAAFQKEFFIKIGGFKTDFKMNEDVNLSYRIIKKGGKLAFNPNAIVYHLHPDTLIKYLKTKLWRGYWRIQVYKEFQHKIISDDYTPEILKIQIIIWYFSFIFLITSFFYSKLIYLFVLSLLIMLITMFNFIKFAVKKNLKVGLLSPFFLFIRATAIAIGVGLGLIKIVIDFLFSLFSL